MLNQQLENVRVAVLVMDGVEETSITQPMNALVNAGATVDVISQHRADLQAFERHTPTIKIAVDQRFDDVSPEDYDAVFLPGGALHADALRAVPAAQAFAASFDNADKPVAALCHAAWLLISADLLEGRILTSYHTLRDDIENAGGTWVDEAVITDGNLVTGRQPSDIPAFNERMLALFATPQVLYALQMS